METTVKRPKETLEEQYEVVKRMKMRHPEWQFDICTLCGDWAMIFPNANGMHLWCNYNTKNKRKNRNIVDENQGLFFD